MTASFGGHPVTFVGHSVNFGIHGRSMILLLVVMCGHLFRLTINGHPVLVQFIICGHCFKLYMRSHLFILF